MAEFAKVMQEYHRMCDAHATCTKCGLRKTNNPEEIPCYELLIVAYELFEQCVMKWAAENPEPKGVTWAQWQDAAFPKAKDRICPAMFGAGNCDLTCPDCRNRPIPADIAEKLGVKKIVNKGGNEK